MFYKFEFVLHSILAVLLYLLDQICFGLVMKLLVGTRSKPVAWPQSADLRGRIVIVTGSNTGIGKATAEQLALFGATVILACRDETRGKLAESDINMRVQMAASIDHPFASSGKAMFMMLNLGDLHHVWEFSNEFRHKFGRLDIIINNAGMNVDEVLPNGLKQLFQVNYLGHYLLFRCLKDLILLSKVTQNEVGRVVNLSSVMHHCGHPNYKVSALSNISSAFTTASSSYDDSKLFMNLFTMEINRRFASTFEDSNQYDKSHQSRPIFAVSANPGAVLSDIWRHLPFQTLVRGIFRIIFLNTWQGSATSVYAAIVEQDEIQKYIYPSGDQSRQNIGGRMHFHRYLPYLVPYFMPYRMLAFEIMGPFGGPRFSCASLPSRSDAFRVRSISRLSHNQRSYSGNNLGTLSVDDMSSNSFSGFSSNHSSNANLNGLDPMFSINSRASSRMVEFASPEDLALQLWRYSGYICHKILSVSGLSDDQLTFLKD